MGRHKTWSDEKMEEFKRLYPVTCNTELAKMYGTCVGTIESRASRYGLKKAKGKRAEFIAKAKVEYYKSIKRPKVKKNGLYWWVLAPSHPKNRNGYVLKHFLIMEGHLGRYLEPNEMIRFKDGDTFNCAYENLELVVNPEHDMKEEHHPNYKDIDPEYILRLREAGYYVKDICEMLGISIELYYRKVRKTGKYKFTARAGIRK